MRWLVNGKLRWHSDNKYKIDWDKPAPSKPAQQVKDFLKLHANRHIWFEEYRVPGTRLKIDFLCPNLKLAIEFDGKQHRTYNSFFHKNRSGFLASIKRDVKKEKFLQENDYTVAVIEDKDLPLTKEFFLKNYNIVL